MLRGFAAFPLYASLIRDPKCAADTALVPSGCLSPDGTASVSSMSRFQHLNLRNYPNSKAAQPIGAAIAKRHLADGCGKPWKPWKPLASGAGSACIVQRLLSHRLTTVELTVQRN